MDSALKLRITYDDGKKLSEDEIHTLLSSSKLIQKLTGTSSDNPLFMIWRLLALSEIPYSERLPYTRDLITKIYQCLALDDGFSYTGEPDDIVPCYNGMIIYALCRLGRHGDREVQKGIEWILNYQSFRRGEKNFWTGQGIQLHGGCLKNVPCYIGICKSLKALIFYRKYTGGVHPYGSKIDEKIDLGLEYILQHKLFRRLSTGEPISRHILDLAFPESYMVTIVELLQIAVETGHMDHPGVGDTLTYLKEMNDKTGGWKTTYIYSGKGYISFDTKSKKDGWIHYFISSAIEKKS